MYMPVKATQSNLFYAQLLAFHDLGYVKCFLIEIDFSMRNNRVCYLATRSFQFKAWA